MTEAPGTAGGPAAAADDAADTAEQAGKQGALQEGEGGMRVVALPDMPPEQQGTSSARHRNYTVSVTNAAGYLCHISLECQFDAAPEVLFAIFCHPDNAGAFRDIKAVGYRKVTSSQPGLKVVEVEQLGELKVLWVRRVFRTYLAVTEDSRDPECLKTSFALLRSDILARFQGGWELRPLRDAEGRVVGCRATLTQDVLPKGVPSFFANVPVLGGVLRRVSLSAIQRVCEDVLTILKRYNAASPRGGTLDDVIAAIAAERGHATLTDENRPGRLAGGGNSIGNGGGGSSSNGNGGGSSNGNGGSSHVTSFAIDQFSESGSESEEVEEGEEQAEDEGKEGEGQRRPATQQPEAVGGGGGGSERSSADGDVTAAVLAAPPAAAGAAAKAHHRHAHGRGRGAAPAVGVLLDVTVHGRVHVVLVPNPEAAAV